MKNIKVIVIAIISFVFFANFVSLSATLKEGKLKNGLSWKIYKYSNEPIVSVNVKIKAGSIFDPLNKFGLAYVTGKSLENCDTSMLSNDNLKKMFDKYGIEESITINKGYIDINLTGLSEYSDKMFYLLNNMLNSKFDSKGVDFVRRETENGIKSLKNNKDYLAIHAAFTTLIKQRSINHTSLGTIKGVSNINREDVLRFFKTYFAANNMVISVSGGGFSEKHITKEIKNYLSGVNKSINKEIIFEHPQFNKGFHIKDIVKDQTQQSYIYFVFPSVGCCNKEYYASKILAYILGGSLNSVLTKDIRTKHGYAYSVFAFNYKLPKGGVFIIGMQTQNKFTLKAIKRVFIDINNISKFLTNKNIDLAKDYFSGSIPISLQTPQSISPYLSEAYFNDIKGLPWEHFLKQIQAVSKNDVTDIAGKIFNDTLTIGIVSYKDFSKQIKEIAKSYGYR